MAITTLTLAVVGADHPNRKGPGRRFEIALCRPGEPVRLVPEPANPVDPRAVMVMSERDVQIGYLTAERCGWIGGLLAGGRDIRALFQERTPYGALIRVSLDGSEPVLPPARESPAADPDFWPDPIYPDL